MADRGLDDAVAGLTVSCPSYRYRLRADTPSVQDGLTEEARDVLVGRMRPQLVRRTRLGDAPLAHDGDAISERERLRLIVRHVQRSQVDLGEEPVEIGEEPFAERAIERSERLVQEKDARLGRERARERDALLLSARERRDRAPLEAGKPDELEQLAARDDRSRSGASPRIRRPNATFAATSR